MIIDINAAEKVCDLATETYKLNASSSAKWSGTKAHIFQVDTTTVLDNGDHPVVGATLKGLGSWVVAQPIGDFEKSYEEKEKFPNFFHLIQSDDDRKTPATFFNFTMGVLSMVKTIQELLDTYKDNSLIGVIRFNEGIVYNPLFVIRYNQDTESTVVEVFDIK